MNILKYETKYYDAVKSIELLEEDLRFAKPPLENLASARKNENRHPTLVMEGQQCLAFFTLHEGDGPESYSSNPNAIFFRSFVVDSRYRGKGIGKYVIQQLDQYIKEVYPQINEIVLVVNTDNPKAKYIYEQAGYRHTGKSTMIGKPVYVMSHTI